MRQRGASVQGGAREGEAEEGKAPGAGGHSRFAFLKWTGEPHFDLVCSYAAVVVFICLCAELTSPTAYGRFGVSDAAISLDPRIGWWLMELPCSMCFVYFFFVRPGAQKTHWVPRLFAFVFLCHYLYRGWIFPALIRPRGPSNFALLTAFGSWMVTVCHGYLNARWFANYGKHLKPGWLKDPRFLLGAAMYYSGLGLVIWHDHLMRTLRDGPGPRYRIPRGGLFDYATCGHYLAELWMWLGFAVMSWGPNGAFIFLVSCVNLIPRAVTTHAWYLSKFNGTGGAEVEAGVYPADRARLLPFVW
eukprot:TRINITY_DN55693_c0_g1_i1.p2 TRINITY_DN55693_c0_g1~~TRINITY_DN55693_c0_g1_i1.p2  ORF type:complete len:330 (+),score=131.40 TRINITY_DN55693_c0_g1_i1:85-990(+)